MPPSDDKLTFVVSVEDETKRLDVFVAEKLPDISRSGVKNILKKGLVLVDGGAPKASHKVKPGESVLVSLPPPEPIEIEPENIPLDIIHEDDDIIVVNKTSGMAVHPGAGRTRGTLVNALVHHTTFLASSGAPLRPGIVHRLDMDTTGVLVIAKNDRSYLKLSKQFSDHTTTRHYRAIVWGAVKNDDGTIDMPIGRDRVNRKKISPRSSRTKRAVTHYRVLKRWPQVTLLDVSLDTGRTHQVRVHLSAAGHPVVGDQVYSPRIPPPNMAKPVADAIKKLKHQCLHAISLGFEHPSTGLFTEYTAAIPPTMAELIGLLDGTCS